MSQLLTFVHLLFAIDHVLPRIAWHFRDSRPTKAPKWL